MIQMQWYMYLLYTTHYQLPESDTLELARHMPYTL